MKINHRIILVNLLIVAIVLGSVAIAFYSIMYSTLTAQQSKIILNSSRNFTLTYKSFTDKIDEEFWNLKNNYPEFFFERPFIAGNLNDFFLEASTLDSSVIIRHSAKSFIQIPKQNFTIDEFIQLNPYAIINAKNISADRICYYGKIISNEVLDDFSKRIGSDIALVWENFTAEVSNSSQNNQHVFFLGKAYNSLKQKSESEVFVGDSETSDIIATSYKTEKLSRYGNDLSFVIFRSHSEATDLRTTLRNILVLIGIVGIILALILSYVLTHKLRIRISDLNYATAQTSTGNFGTRIKVQSNDEIGNLGNAFNLMLDELEKNQRIKNEYSEFITLINKNASLTEISNAALNKIINTCDFLVGALYSVDNDEINLICSYGISDSNPKHERSDFFKKIIQTKEQIEIKSELSLPMVQAGALNIKLNYLLLLPVTYNNKVTAILELASSNEPNSDSKDYLERIKEQLAIGLTNAKAVVQLENFVNELKLLNDEYQKQNLQIKKQNDTLLELSNQLQVKAEELAIQKEKAEDSTRLKSHFLASMSHELRTPMNSILGLTELILDKAQLSIKNKERLEVVLKSGKRLMNLINDILDLSKIEAGKMEIRDEDVLLEEIIDEVSITASPLALEKGLNFNIKRNCNTRIIINTDRAKVTQVLINLIGNAIKFTSYGKVELSVSFNRDKMLVFSVSDTGIGISEDNKKIIFEEFRQIDGTSSKKYSGTGLGLAISKKILDLMGGKIWVTSAEGEGSVFSFTIPIKYQKEKWSTESPGVKSEALVRRRIQKIVIVDDDELEFEKFKNEFKDGKVTIEYVQNSEFAFNKIAEVQPDLIVLDLIMSKVDGITLAQRLKSDNKTKYIPIIISTAKNLTDDEQKFLKRIVEEITIKSTGHSIDIIKSVRDRIQLWEDEESSLDSVNITDDEPTVDYYGEVLIVDDDPDTLFTLNEMVQATGCKTYLAKSGLESLKILEDIRPDLILLDIMMPEMDGFQTLKNIRSNNNLAGIPIYAVTAKAMVGDKEIILKHGFNDYIPKPVSSTIISSKIAQIFSKTKAGRI